MLIQPAASITKAQISPLGELKGKVNDATVYVDGASYGPGSLRFNGFAGRLVDIPSKKYSGVIRLERVKPNKDNTTCDFSEILAAISEDIATEDADV